jgi:hypothetical protein
MTAIDIDRVEPNVFETVGENRFSTDRIFGESDLLPIMLPE